MKRRDFIAGATFGSIASGLSACSQTDTPSSQTQRNATTSTDPSKIWQWNMVTSWPPLFPGLGTGADYLAKTIEKASGGRIKIKVYAAGELVPALEVFDAVANGAAQLGHSGAYYWKGKSPATQLFGAVPFGMNSMEICAWILHGGGDELYKELYAKFNLVPFLAGFTGVQMGGWFNKEISSIDDIKGLKMRIPGLGGEVIKRAGGIPVNRPGGELFTALQTGDIDATEWVGPYNDLSFGLYKAAQYYYYPGWHEPSAALECIINQDAWNELPEDLQQIIKISCDSAAQNMGAEYTANNPRDLRQLVEQHNVEIREFPPEVLSTFKRYAEEILNDLSAQNAEFNKIYRSYRAFLEQVKPWHDISEASYYRAR